MSDSSESDSTTTTTTETGSPKRVTRYKQNARRRERKTQPIGFKTSYLGSLHRKRVRSCDRTNRSKSDSNLKLGQELLDREEEEDKDSILEPCINGGAQARPDSGYSEDTNLKIDDVRKISIQSEGGEFENDFEKYTYKAMCKLQELITTEQSYVQNLKEIVEGYYEYMEESKKTPKPEGMVQMPQDLQNGKDRIIFGNIRDIYEYHKRTILPELEKSLMNIGHLKNLFATRKDTLKTKYGRFCLNKPKSEYIITQHTDYFSLIRMAKEFKHHLSSQLMTPIQRVTRYPLLLHDIMKMFEKAGDQEKKDIIQKAYEIANEVAEYANNMMNAGRIQGFHGDVTRQGLLLMCGDAMCYKRRHTLSRPKVRPCQIFVFQESIIFCLRSEMFNSGSAFRPQLDFFTCFQMNKMHAREVNRGSDSCWRFELERREDGKKDILKTDERVEAKPVKPEINCLVVQCDTEVMRDKWLKTINDQIKELQTLANNLSNPAKNYK